MLKINYKKMGLLVLAIATAAVILAVLVYWHQNSRALKKGFIEVDVIHSSMPALVIPDIDIDMSVDLEDSADALPDLSVDQFIDEVKVPEIDL